MDIDDTDRSSFIICFLHSLFNQCNVSLNGVFITPSRDLYIYRLSLNLAVLLKECRYVTSHNRFLIHRHI